MKTSMNLEQDKPLTIKETSKDFFEVILPVCDSSILANILDTNVPWVTLVGFWVDWLVVWIEEHMPPLFDPARRLENVHVKQLKLDVSLKTAEFLRILPSFKDRGVELVQGVRPLPHGLSIDELKPESKAHILREVGITLHFYIPHPHEHALVGSPSRDILERIVSTIRQ